MGHLYIYHESVVRCATLVVVIASAGLVAVAPRRLAGRPAGTETTNANS